jgi:hypothetical protein
MDVGFNNKNMLGEIDPAFKDVVFFVDATTEEQFGLWREYSKESMTNIEPISEDFIQTLPENFRGRVEKLNNQVKRAQHKRIDWKQVSSGFGLTLGKLDDRPICVCFSFAYINGHKICFYEATSQVVDHKLIEKWLKTHFQLTHDGYTRWNHTNATNFHNCVSGLENLDKEPRETVYER